MRLPLRLLRLVLLPAALLSDEAAAPNMTAVITLPHSCKQAAAGAFRKSDGALVKTLWYKGCKAGCLHCGLPEQQGCKKFTSNPAVCF